MQALARIFGKIGGIDWSRALNLGRQVFRQELVTLTQDHGALDRVLELAHVARPGVLLEQVQRAGRDLERLTMPEVELRALQEHARESRDLAGALAQWRDGEGDA